MATVNKIYFFDTANYITIAPIHLLSTMLPDKNE